MTLQNKEVVLVRNSEDYGDEVVRMFGVFELRLLHPSYIHFLAKKKFERVKDQDYAQGLRYFIHMIELLSTVYEKLALSHEF